MKSRGNVKPPTTLLNTLGGTFAEDTFECPQNLKYELIEPSASISQVNKGNLENARLEDLSETEKEKICTLVDRLYSSKLKRKKIEEKAKNEKQMLLHRIYRLEEEKLKSDKERQKLRKKMKESKKLLQEYQLRALEENKFESTNPSVSTYFQNLKREAGQSQEDSLYRFNDNKNNPVFLPENQPCYLELYENRIKEAERLKRAYASETLQKARRSYMRHKSSPLRYKPITQNSTVTQSIPVTTSQNLYHRQKISRELEPQHQASVSNSSCNTSSFRSSTTGPRHTQISASAYSPKPTNQIKSQRINKPSRLVGQHNKNLMKKKVYSSLGTQKTHPSTCARSSKALKQFASIASQQNPRLNARNMEHILDPEGCLKQGDNEAILEISHLKREVLEMTSSIKKLLNKSQNYESSKLLKKQNSPIRQDRDAIKFDNHCESTHRTVSSQNSLEVYPTSKSSYHSRQPSLYELRPVRDSTLRKKCRPPKYLLKKRVEHPTKLLKSPEAKDIFSRYKNAVSKPICPRKASIADLIDIQKTLSKDLLKTKQLIQKNNQHENQKRRENEIERSFKKFFISEDRENLRRTFDDQLLLKDIQNFESF